MNLWFIFIPLLAAVIGQIVKLIIYGIKGQFAWQDLNSYGGMPSTHSALVVSLCALVGYFEGWESAAFAVALVLAVLTIRDAGGFRRTLGRHAQELNQIIHNLKADEAGKYPHLKERLGHTPLEIFVGALIGLITAVGYILLVV